jgi:hypothetical protein
LQLAAAKVAAKQSGHSKKTPITFDPNNLGGSTSTSLSIRKEDMDIDSTETSPNDWQPAKGRDKGKNSSK